MLRDMSMQRGVTLIECMVVLAILSILLGLAAPLFQEIIKRYRVRVAAEALSSSLYLARSEAIKRSGRVVMRKTALPGCPGALVAGRWECGWQLFVDANGNSILDADEVLLHEVGLQADVVITRGPATNVKAFNQWGHVAGLGTFNFLVWPRQDAQAQPPHHANAMLLCMSAGGRLRVVKGQAPPCA
ncbi:GspH/FimT family pseudopilin [Corticibacter populi]|nr:GspH/FimT family pseudopilin [Corticibacter populi]